MLMSSNKEKIQNKIFIDVYSKLKLLPKPPARNIRNISASNYLHDYINFINLFYGYDCDIKINHIEVHIDKNKDDTDIIFINKHDKKQYYDDGDKINYSFLNNYDNTKSISAVYTNVLAYINYISKEYREASSSSSSEQVVHFSEYRLKRGKQNKWKYEDLYIEEIDDILLKDKKGKTKFKNAEYLKGYIQNNSEKFEKLEKLYNYEQTIEKYIKLIKEDIKNCKNRLTYILLTLENRRIKTYENRFDKTVGHQNIIIIDKEGDIELYEPNYLGTEDEQEQFGNFLANDICKLLAKQLNKNYLEPKGYCIYGLQTLEGDSILSSIRKQVFSHKNPGGFCVAFSLLWLALRMVYPSSGPATLHSKMETMGNENLARIIEDFTYTILMNTGKLPEKDSSSGSNSEKLQKMKQRRDELSKMGLLKMKEAIKMQENKKKEEELAHKKFEEEDIFKEVIDKLEKLKLKGGKLVSQGAYGCVLDADVGCYDRIVISKVPTKIYTKVFEEVSETDIEWNNSIIISKIDPNFNNFIYSYEKCFTTYNELLKDKSINKCNLNLLIDKNRIGILKMPYGGIKIREYLNKYKITFKNFINSIISLFEGVVKLNNANMIHQDIKLDNILYTHSINKWRYIDYGLMVEKKDIYSGINDFMTQCTKINCFLTPPEYRIYHNVYNIYNTEYEMKDIKLYNIDKQTINEIYNTFISSNEYKRILLDFEKYANQLTNKKSEFLKLANKIDIYSLGLLLMYLTTLIHTDNIEYRNLIIEMIYPDPRNRITPEKALERIIAIKNSLK
jgi:hypothetical protein